MFRCTAFLCALATGCVNSNVDYAPTDYNSVIEVSSGIWNDIDLTIGYMSLSGKVYDTSNEIHVEWSSGVENFQVITHVHGEDDQDPDFLRVVYTSDRVEWVGISGLDSVIYKSQEQCEHSGSHCDPVVPAESVSGVVDYGGSFKAIANSWCQATENDYSYNISAYVVDISWPDPVRTSDITTINVECVQL